MVWELMIPMVGHFFFLSQRHIARLMQSSTEPYCIINIGSFGLVVVSEKMFSCISHHKPMQIINPLPAAWLRRFFFLLDGYGMQAYDPRSMTHTVYK